MKKFINQITSAVFLFVCINNYAQTGYHDTQGKLDISDNGQATYTLPIAMPPSIQDVGPTINIVYASGQMGGIAGQGWNISSISSISRISARIDIDGYVDGVDFDANDKLALDGQRLLGVAGNYWADGSTYQTEILSNSKIELKGTGTNIYFIVSYPDGSRAWYGNYGGMNATDLTAYYITRFEDTNGTFITYHYNKPYNKSLCINEIKFSANINGLTTAYNRIKFNYKLAKRVESAYIKGVRIEKVELLSNIEVFTNTTQLFKRYVLSHIVDPQLGYERVSEIQEFNSILEPANPVVFEYDTTQGVNLSAIEPPKIYTNNLNFNEVKLSGDFDGDGSLDFITENELHTNLFQSNSGETIYNIQEAILPKSFVTTTLKNSKINQFSTIVNPVLEENLLKLRFLDLNGTQVSLSYENTYPINNLINCNVNCPFMNCNTLGDELNFTHQYLEGDFNGDGKSQVLLIMHEVKKETEWVSVGSGEISQNPNHIDPDNPAPSFECRYNTEISNTNISFRILNIEPNSSSFDSFSPPIQYSTHAFFSAKKYTADFNGDGKTDLLVVFGDSKYQIISFYNNSSSTAREIIGQGIFDDFLVNKEVLLGDYNGDGKTDIMIPDTEGGSGHDLWHIYYSNPNPNGGSFFEKESHNIVEYWPNTGSHFNTQTHFSSYYAMDINDDGKSDLVRVWRKHYKPKRTINDHNTQWKVTAFANNIGNTQISGNKFTIEYSSWSDHDGDSPDLVIPIASNFKVRGLDKDLILVHNHWNRVFSVKFEKDVSKDIRIKTVKASNNAIVDNIEYSSLKNGFYTSGNSLNYPFIELKTLPRNFVVSRLINSAVGVTKMQDFKYHGLAVHLQGLGSIGFGKTARSAWYQNLSSPRIWNIKENNPNLRGATENAFSTLSNSGTINLQYISNNSNDIISKTTSVFSNSTLNGLYKIQLESNTVKDYKTGVSTQVSYTYDPIFLLPLIVTTKNFTTSPLNAIGTKTTTTIYDNNPNGVGLNYHIGRPIEITSVTSAYSDTFTTNDKYTYTNNRLTKTEKRGNTTDNKYLVEEFEYNAVGNVTKKTLSSTGYSFPQDFAPRITEYTYDTSQRFIKTSKDIEGLISTNVSYHPIYGVVTESQNPFGHTTKSYVDSWGKVYKVTDYLGKNGLISYTKTNGEYIVTKTSDDGGSSVEISDVLGRSKKSGVKNIDNNWSYVSAEYDFYGRKYRVSEPYSSGGPTQWSTDSFDVYGRQLTNVRHTGLTTNITYSGLTVSATDGIKTTSSTKNANGHLVSSNDNGGIINFQYFADGNLKQSNYDGTIVSMHYDEWGRKDTLNDPSAGKYTYTYNALGETLTETTPNGKTTYGLNNVGKIVTKDITTTNGTNGNSNTTYYYNATTKLLEHVDFWDQYEAYNLEYYYTYDTYNRLIKTVESRTDAVFEFTNEVEYDAFGRPLRERNKGVFAGKTVDNWVKNTFKNGYHWQILDDATNAILWQTNNVNARGQLTSANLGNGIAINKSYDSNGYITQSTHFNATTPSNNLMTLNTSFEAQRGNLITRYNSLFNRTENFQYDNLDRLTHYTNAEGIQVQQVYETDGRIKQNDLGTYNYSNNAKKYQNTSIDVNDISKAYYENRLGLFNESMEAKQGWTINEPNIFSYDATIAKTGATSLKINNTTTGEKVVHSDYWIKIDNAAPTQYTYSVWVKSDGSNPNAEIFLFMKTENETGYFTQVDSKINTTNTGWALIEKTFLVPANIKKLNIRLDNNSTGILWFDDVRIRKTSDALTTERKLNISYNMFKSPFEIEETGVDKITFNYNPSNSRSSMYYGGLQSDKLQRQYHKHYAASGTLEAKINTLTNEVEFISYIGGDAYSAPVVLKSNGTNKEYLYLHRDYQSSIVAISNQSGAIVEKRLFDAWGQVVRVHDQQGNVLAGLTVLDRGYTGHEHLQSVGLIHMNGRLYDAKLHRFLQPDNYIQDPYNTQNYNRYGYVLNNPLKYVDPSGEEFISIGTAILVGAIIGATTYTLTALLADVPFSAGGFIKASFLGGLSGAVSFGIGSAVQTLPTATKIVVGALMHGSSQAGMAGIQGGDPLSAFASGALSSIAAGLWSTGGSANQWKGLGGNFARSNFGTIAFGTVSGGAGAALTKGNFWQGAATGLTVSLLNHVAHKMNQQKSKYNLSEKDIKKIYDNYPHPNEKSVDELIKDIGGPLEIEYNKQETLHEELQGNTCALRLSYAMNKAGYNVLGDYNGSNSLKYFTSANRMTNNYLMKFNRQYVYPDSKAVASVGLFAQYRGGTVIHVDVNYKGNKGTNIYNADKNVNWIPAVY